MKFHSLRKSLLGAATAIATTILLGSCGGGGAANDPLQGGQLSFLPTGTGGAGATYYAGIPVTLAVAGGKRPYALFSSEPGILPVPTTLDGNTFTVIPNNPGVIDSGLSPEDLPRRTINLTARDTTGLQASVQVAVAQNFLTGYGVFYTSNCPTSGSAAPFVCSGGETAVRMAATFNGALAGNRTFRFDILKGPAFFVFPGTNNTGKSITTVSDHAGIVTALMRVDAGTPTQVGVLRVTDVASGVYADHVFVISQGQPTSATITAVPNEFRIAGPTDQECGTGSFDTLVFDGAAPITGVSSDPNLRVTRVGGSGDQPQRFTISAINPAVCLNPGVVVFTDATGARTTVEVITERGPAPPALPALAVAPTTLTLTCGSSGSVSVVGGTGRYTVNSTHPRVTAVVSGSTVTITRLAGDGASAFPTSAGISISDGLSAVTVTATVPGNCP